MYGSYIRAARERAGLSPTEAAVRVGYKTPDMIYKIESDKASASLEMLDKLADAFGVRVGDLLPNSGASPTESLCAPILATLVGFDDQTTRELITYLSEQGRIAAQWRRRDTRVAEKSSSVRPSVRKGTDERGTAVETSGTPSATSTSERERIAGRRHGQSEAKGRRGRHSTYTVTGGNEN